MESGTIQGSRSKDYYTREAYKALRTNIQFCGDDQKVLAITSCTPNEGKSTVSFELAISLAENGNRVAFIDADLRKSVLVGRYKLKKNLKGLTHYLSGQSELKDVIWGTDVENFHAVFAGPIPPNPAELLNGRRFKEMVRALRANYDYVIIDTPPLGSVIDGAIVAQECDGAVLVVEARRVSYRFVQKVKDQIEKAGCSLMGVVLNKVRIHEDKYYSKYYGTYYGEEPNL